MEEQIVAGLVIGQEAYCAVPRGKPPSLYLGYIQQLASFLTLCFNLFRTHNLIFVVSVNEDLLAQNMRTTQFEHLWCADIAVS
jgi:hypothetical protein